MAGNGENVGKEMGNKQWMEERESGNGRVRVPQRAEGKRVRGHGLEEWEKGKGGEQGGEDRGGRGKRRKGRAGKGRASGRGE